MFVRSDLTLLSLPSLPKKGGLIHYAATQGSEILNLTNYFILPH